MSKHLRLLGQMALLALVATLTTLGALVVLTTMLAAAGLVEVQVSTR